MTIPSKYPAAQEVAIANYDYTDIADGTGVKVFYGIASTSGAIINYHLITNTDAYSEPVGTTHTAVGPKTLNFDLSAFNLPRIAQGTAFLSCGIGADGGAKVYVSGAIVQHVRGATVTDISPVISSQQVTGSPDSSMVFLPLALTTQKFERGDILRLAVTFYALGGTATSIGHDPKNQTFGSINPSTKDSTIMALHMPFKIEL